MGNMMIESVHIEQFKGERDKVYTLGKRTDIVGANGSGKTTVGMACYLPFTGKDLQGKSNPEVHPSFMEESEPNITLDCDIDGKPVQIEWTQQDIRTKRQKEEGAPVRTSTKYKVNGVEMSQTAFKKKMSEYGIDLDDYEKLTSTLYFKSLKETDKRSLIFALADESLTDMAICQQMDAPELLRELNSYSLTEIEQLQKQNRNASKKLMDALPEQIKGLEEAKPIDDFISLREQRALLMSKVPNLQAEIDSLVQTQDYDSLIRAERVKRDTIISNANKDRTLAREEARLSLADTEREISWHTNNIAVLERQIRRDSNNIADMIARKDVMLSEYAEKKSEKFPSGKSVCPTCGQKLPKEKIDALKEDWKKSHDAEVESMKNIGNQLVMDISKAQKELEKSKEKLTEWQTKLSALELEKADKQKAYEEAMATVDTVTGDDIPEVLEIEKKISELLSEQEKARANQIRLSELKEQMTELWDYIHDFDIRIAREDIISDINIQIQQKREEQRLASQNVANAERILYQIEKLNMRKNELLSESVNKHFDGVRFVLFRTQKNGEVVNCCRPEILAEDGTWKDADTIANTALKLKGDIEILNGLQKFYGVSLPIILDGGECFDSKHRQDLKCNCQLITLSVSENPVLTVNEL